MELVSQKFVGVFRVAIGYTDTKMKEIGQLFVNVVFCPKIVKSVFFQKVRAIFCFIPQMTGMLVWYMGVYNMPSEVFANFFKQLKETVMHM